MTVKHTLVSSDMRVFALCSLMELHRCKTTGRNIAKSILNSGCFFMQSVYKKLRIYICFIDDEPNGKMLQ